MSLARQSPCICNLIPVFARLQCVELCLRDAFGHLLAALVRADYFSLGADAVNAAQQHGRLCAEDAVPDYAVPYCPGNRLHLVNMARGWHLGAGTIDTQVEAQVGLGLVYDRIEGPTVGR